MEFSFKLLNNEKKKTKIRLEYGIYYQKANGTLSKKVHKISEKEYAEKSITQITRKQSFREITTRKFHPGLHQISVILNGKEFEKHNFELIGDGKNLFNALLFASRFTLLNALYNSSPFF